MNAIRINVNRQIDGYTFSITPSIREFIKKLLPNAQPANGIFVAYDTKSGFEALHGRIEKHIFPVLLGIDDKQSLDKIDEIDFVDNQTGKILYKANQRDKEI